MQQPLLLSTGEFAQMCNVSRELLVHYDKIGLLKPKEVRGNGYRYYSLKQLYLFDVIRFFMDTGMSTKEIKEYLDNRTTQLFLDSIQTSIDRMELQRDILDARIGMMEKMRYITQRAVTFPKEQPRLSYWDEIWFLTTDVRRERTQQVYAQAVSEHSDFCRNTAGMATFPLGRIIDIPDPRNPAEFYYTKLVTWISPPKNPERLEGRIERKPKGNYAVILHQGGTSTVERSYEKLLNYVEREGFEMQGPLYELDMNSYLMSDSAEDYLLHISVLVNVEDAADAFAPTF
ncbi:MerR family transcriptional regulator [Gordonibacter massiliensis (ex Traore et al. 2017)]|uniref:MerR family transcriptional regulator n=1 Tax=Gordonibacter massiliensis (ex Traore et al. 2017) TaxID=1841863 RepID=A0A842JHP3_9ACTN|nr:MerR family transcriptional regulator [Gordonibacter massiliensis (ex Traore et al. 2017)]MBC2890556.1 MerR family transcriptional regulator [Gordonibacter massiliensis (ex Traore et al. 2017)]MBX9035327.1 MerR family transcriptional regulator [Gordonibacter massiliensis (ex Traore et al. 2017)]